MRNGSTPEVLITASSFFGAELARRLRSEGLRVLELPLWDVRPAKDTRPLDRTLAHLGAEDWIVFTSRNGVDHVLRRIQALALQPSPLAIAHVAAVGSGTAQALQRAGCRVDFLPSTFRWQELAAELAGRLDRGTRIVLPRGDRAGPELPQAFRNAGLRVEEVVAYHSLLHEVNLQETARRLQGEPAVVLVLGSAAAARSIRAALGEDGMQRVWTRSTRPLVACIGPNTATEAALQGFPTDIVPHCALARTLAHAIAVRVRDGRSESLTGKGDGT